MSNLNDLLSSYKSFIATPWTKNLSPEERVIFIVYDPKDERRFRLKIKEFELKTQEVNHSWTDVDLESSFSEWMINEKYKEKYFHSPSLLTDIKMENYLNFIVYHIQNNYKNELIDTNRVFSFYGVGSLYGFIKVKQLIDKLAPLVAGRLLVFFPGTHIGDNFRLLGGYDGWNYLATVID